MKAAAEAKSSGRGGIRITNERRGMYEVCDAVFVQYLYTAEPAYSRLQGNKEYRLLKEKCTVTGIE